MNALHDRRVIAALGGVVILLLVVLLSFFILRAHPKAGADAAPAGGLQIEQGQADSRTGATKPLRCFVGGQFVGMATGADCAQKNGVSAQALDVGLDPATGQATTPGGTLAPPVQAAPPAPPAAAARAETPEAALAPAPGGPPAECLRYTPDGWRGAGSGVSVGQCVRTLFDGRCEHAGEALYGRWGQDTLRLVPGRVEMSADNRSFHPLMAQAPDCSLPPG
jgi:hypothetical protein